MAQLIIGHVTTTSAKIWVRGLDGQTSATMTLTDKDGRISLDGPIQLQLPSATYNTAVQTFHSLQADTKYFCSALFNDDEAINGSFSTMPAQADEFCFLLGSCHFSLGPDHTSPEFKRIQEIATINQNKFMISCGDQMYIDIVRPISVNSEGDYAKRYAQTWHSEELSNFFANLPQYMIIDDHEIFNDFVNENLTVQEQNWFAWALKTYGIFQHSHNPGNGTKLYYEFECAHAAFFVMDLRTERTSKQMISEEQLQRLISWYDAENTKDKIKFIVSSVPFITQLTKHEQNDKWSGNNYLSQRDKIIEFLMASKDKKVIFLSGDIHLASHAFISYTSGERTYQIHELISSPIKQVGFSILSHKASKTLMVNDKALQYNLGNHMGGPYENAQSLHLLRNNVMSISVRNNSLFYKVYALNKDKVVFEDEISFD